MWLKSKVKKQKKKNSFSSSISCNFCTRLCTNYTDPFSFIFFSVMCFCTAWKYIRLQRNSKAAADVDYPAYGVTGPNKDSSPSGDQRLAQSAQMYHFQHQKQQIIAMEK